MNVFHSASHTVGMAGAEVTSTMEEAMVDILQDTAGLGEVVSHEAEGINSVYPKCKRVQYWLHFL